MVHVSLFGSLRPPRSIAELHLLTSTVSNREATATGQFMLGLLPWFILRGRCAHVVSGLSRQLLAIECTRLLMIFATMLYRLYHVLIGGAENAGRENDGREIDGPICRA